MGKKFVTAQVERANDDGLGFQGRGDLAVGLVLLRFGGKRFPVDEQIFRAKQAHACRAAGKHPFGVARLFDVRGEDHTRAVERDRRLLAHLAQFFLQRDPFAHELPVLEQRLVRRIGNDLAVVAVQQDLLAAPQFPAGLLQTDHCRNAH